MLDQDTHTIVLKHDGLKEASFECADNELVLEAARRQGIYMASYCKQGGCGACESQMVKGRAHYIRSIKGAPQSPVEGDAVRPCSMQADSDLILAPLSDWKITD